MPARFGAGPAASLGGSGLPVDGSRASLFLKSVLVRNVGHRDHDPRVRPAGGVILHSQPLYGGTETLFAKTLAGLSIDSVGFSDGVDESGLGAAAQDAMRKGSAQGHTPLVACDNTLLGPVFQRSIEQGADLSLYSLTKYVGGHSDLIAGAALGSTALMKDVKLLRGPSAPNWTHIPVGC
jgi:cystathionine beta-lyase/cystathionine gamma-synthase